MSVTQKQIADHLGVSQSLVAHALKGYPRISEETRKRVETAARELGYGNNDNSAARMLRSRRSGNRPTVSTIAVLMGDFFEGFPLQDIPFYKPLFLGMKQEAARRELDLLFFGQAGRIPRIVKDGGVDGVISLYSGPASMLFRQLEPRCPVLRVGDGAIGEWVLRPDDYQGMYLATQHLIERGHRRIAYLGDLVGAVPDLAYKSRLDGYLQALKDGGVAVQNQLVEAHIESPDHESGETGMARLLDRGADFTAVVCFNDASAVGAMRELKRRGRQMPEDICVTGYDDVNEVNTDLPGLTSIYFDRIEMGRRAVEAVYDAAQTWDGPDSLHVPENHELLPVQLVVRDSSGTAA